MNKLTCEKCAKTKCKHGIDCYAIQQQCIAFYQRDDIKQTAFAASALIDNGRAGTLSRLNEIIEYCTHNKYKKIGIAYCIAFDAMARELAEILRNNNLEPLSVVCTAGGVKEKDIDPAKTTETVSCNPAGQSILLEEQQPDFIIEMGLCLGHDVLFHSGLDVPFTVFIVKDRVYNHTPALALDSYKDRNAMFLEELDSSFAMKTPEWLEEQVQTNEHLTIIDLRGAGAYNKGHIPISVNISLKELPQKYKTAVPDKTTTIVCVCNGSVQSAYAIMFLFSRGYRDVHNLSGGFGRWEKEGRETASSG